MKAPYPYKKAELVQGTGKDGWYITYYIYHVQKGKTIRKRKFIPASYKTAESKKAYAKDLIKKINMLLKEGYHIDLSKQEEQEQKADYFDVKFLTVAEGLEEYVEICLTEKKLKKRGVDVKRNSINAFITFCTDELNLQGLLIREIDEKIVKAYFKYLLRVKKLANKSYNNYKGDLHAFYEQAIFEQWTDVKENPFAVIENLKTTYGEKNLPYTQEQLNEIVPYIQEHDPYLYNIVAFVYYGFMRISEIKQLRIRDIDFERKLLKIYSNVSKVKEFDTIPIAPELWNVIESMELHKYPRHFHIFSGDYEPNEEPLGVNFVTKKFKKVKTKFNLDIDHTAYSFKHTAVCRWYVETKDIVRIQKMCRHTTIEMTARYLKSLGLLTDTMQIDTLPAMV